MRKPTTIVFCFLLFSLSVPLAAAEPAVPSSTGAARVPFKEMPEYQVAQRLMSMSTDELTELSLRADAPSAQRLTAANFLCSKDRERGREVLSALTTDADPTLRDLAFISLAGFGFKDQAAVTAFREAARSGDFLRQFGGVMGLLAVGGEDNLALVDEVYRAPQTGDILKVEIAKAWAKRGDSFDKSIALDVLYRRLASPDLSTLGRWLAATDLARLGDRSELIRLGKSVVSDDAARYAVFILKTTFPLGPNCDYSDEAEVVKACLGSWQAYLAGVDESAPGQTVP